MSEEQQEKGKVKVGDAAPDFTLPNQSGQMVSLKDFFGKKSVVLFFYPKDFSRGCTNEVCAFRDSYEVFKNAGAEVIGVSSQSTSSHERFVMTFKLPFILLSDEDDKVRKLYGVPSTLALIPGRVTYVIDKEGMVEHIFNSQFNPEKHIEEALKALGVAKKE